jgi:hypothetical protein
LSSGPANLSEASRPRERFLDWIRSPPFAAGDVRFGAHYSNDFSVRIARPRRQVALIRFVRFSNQVRLTPIYERGIFYRKPIGKRATKKRQTPVPIPPRLLAHPRRWKDRKLIATCFVEFNGKPVASVKKEFKTAVGLPRLPGKVIPHTLRHTAATWPMQRGVPIWEAAGFLGMSPEVLKDTYGHHHRDHLHGAAATIGQKGRYVSVVESVVDSGTTSDQKEKPIDFWSEWQDSNLRPLRPERSALPG